MKRMAILLLAAAWMAGCSSAPRPPVADGFAQDAAVQEQRVGAAAATVEDVIPLTMGSVRGHKMLYDEGWFIVSSSKKALSYAREHAIESSGEAIRRAVQEAGRDTSGYGREMAGDVAEAARTGGAIVSQGTGLTGDILQGTHRLAKRELAYSKETFGKAVDVFVTGNITLAKRTEEDRKELAAIPGNYYRDLAGDFANIQDLTAVVRRNVTGKIDASWEKAFDRAANEFRKEYDRSGEAPNTLAALGPVLTGWLKAFYHGIAAPTSKTIVKTTVAGTTYAVFLPVAATSVVAGRTVQAVGLTVYYVGKTGVKVISPTIEGGLLASMSILSSAAVPVTYAGGATVGAVNQVAFTAAGPAYAAGAGAVAATVDTATYVATVTYDAAVGVTKVAINTTSSAVVLGYNALTAIPTHAVLAAGDAVVLLAWDGPRLVIAAARGRIGTKEGDGAASLSDLPVGTVVDLEKLKATPGAEVEVISTDEKVIKDVLEKLPEDLREKQPGN